VQLIIAKFGDIILFREFCASWDISERSNSEFVAFKNSPGIGVESCLMTDMNGSKQTPPFVIVVSNSGSYDLPIPFRSGRLMSRWCWSILTVSS
jgi:hypothetical protein